MVSRVRARNGFIFGWTRRAVYRLKVHDLISPEYNWVAPILAIRPVWCEPDWVLIICNPYPVMRLYDLPLSDPFIQDVIGPHKMKRTARPLYWNGPDDIVAASRADRF